MAHYAGIAGTKQLTDRIGDEVMEVVKKYLRLVKEETGIAAPVRCGGRFKLAGEAALDKEHGLGIAVRAASPNLGPEIPVSLDTELGLDRASRGTVRAEVEFEFECVADLSNVELAAVRLLAPWFGARSPTAGLLTSWQVPQNSPVR